MSGMVPKAIEITGRFSDWSPETLRAFVIAADEAGVELIVLPDSIAPSAGGEGWPDALIVIGWLAAQTKRVKLVGRVLTLGLQPYNLARRLASLDLISQGRAGWLVSKGEITDPHAAFSGAHRLDGVDADEREKEFIEVVRGLWQSWDGDALVLDKRAAQFFKPEAMHPINHEGRHFSVRGPLNVMRSERGAPDLYEDDDDLRLVKVETAEAGLALLRGSA
jgi:alkanesulfonate monooxygenase SsuD/methylene tetrahydromethanopterin reductase-like flavin-dependent oxidoreductase (luciferase family)